VIECEKARVRRAVLLGLIGSIPGRARPGMGQWLCRRGDLVSQRGKEPKARSRSSFNENEGESASLPYRRTSSPVGREACRVARAAGGDIGDSPRDQQLAERRAASLRDHRAKRGLSLRKSVRKRVPFRRRSSRRGSCPSRTAFARNGHVVMLWSISGTRSARSVRRPKPIGLVRHISGSLKGTSRVASTTSITTAS
jgi:hypothetical protein